MEHLSPDTIARLVDDVPDDAETDHLARCEACAGELELARATTEALGQLPDVRPPRGDWAVLEARLMSEGLVHTEGGFRSRLARTPGWMRGAAAVFLFVSGAGMGATLDRPAFLASEAPGAAGSSASFASIEPSTVDDAADAMRDAERVFIDAIVRYRQLAEVDGESENAVDRYAALEYFLAAGEAAVREAPTDLFMNGLLASVRAERQAAREVVLRNASRTQDWY